LRRFGGVRRRCLCLFLRGSLACRHRYSASSG
jgi:hypothetical protein